MWHGYYVGGGWWIMGIGILFWASIIGLLVWAVQRITASRSQRDDGMRPIDYLKIRYAKGDIDKDEYDRIRQHLGER